MPEPQRPVVKYIEIEQVCPMCGAYCKAVHREFFEFFDPFGVCIFQCCSGCLTVAGDAYNLLADTVVVPPNALYN